jgi:hypothetical protein
MHAVAMALFVPVVSHAAAQTKHGGPVCLAPKKAPLTSFSKTMEPMRAISDTYGFAAASQYSFNILLQLKGFVVPLQQEA